MALSSPSQAPSGTEGQPSILYTIPSPRSSAHQTANGTMYPVFRMRPRTAKGNFVITRARAKLPAKGPVGTALPVCPITSPTALVKRQEGMRLSAVRTHDSPHATSALGGHGLMALSSPSQAQSGTEGQPSIPLRIDKYRRVPTALRSTSTFSGSPFCGAAGACGRDSNSYDVVGCNMI